MLDCPPTLYRFSERLFRRYEPTIREMVRAHTPVIDPTKRVKIAVAGSTTTVKGRLSDSIRSLIANRWSTDINIDRLIEVRPQLKLVIEGRTVWIIPRYMSSDGSASFDRDISISDPTELQLRAMMALQHTSAFEGVAFEIVNLSDKLLKQLKNLNKEFPNVVVDTPDPNIPNRIFLI